jgi:GNAT superfamily N-acetyltransferase
MKCEYPATQDIMIRRAQMADLDLLHQYLENLGEETRKRFGPHPFDLPSLEGLFSQPEYFQGFIASEAGKSEIIAYSIIKFGYLSHDSQRLQSYGLQLSEETDCTYAPSVSDHWQGKGISKRIFQFIIPVLLESGRKRVILWGGVQAGNLHAVRYYNSLGFINLGGFEYNGWNYDMIFHIGNP